MCVFLRVEKDLNGRDVVCNDLSVTIPFLDTFYLRNQCKSTLFYMFKIRYSRENK